MAKAFIMPGVALRCADRPTNYYNKKLVVRKRDVVSGKFRPLPGGFYFKLCAIFSLAADLQEARLMAGWIWGVTLVVRLRPPWWDDTGGAPPLSEGIGVPPACPGCRG